MKKHVLKFVSTGIGITLFVVAVVVLHKQLEAYKYSDIVRELGSIPFSAVLTAVFFVLCNFIVLGGYEILGFRYIRNNLSWLKIMLTSFVAFSFSNNVGFYSISGSAVRFRMYSQWGLSTFDIAKLVAFSSGITFWLGLFSICAFVFIAEPLKLPVILHLPFASTNYLGLLFVIPVTVMIALTIFRKKPIKISSFEFDIPSTWLTVCLIVLACLDWIFFCAVLYTLYPLHTVSFPVFLSIFLTAQIIGIISHVPGGLGVFESMFILLIPDTSVDKAMGALLLFRVVYYLLPLILSSIVLGLHELFLRKKAFGKIAQIFGQWTSGVVPYLFGIMTFVAGIIMLFSGALPGTHERMLWLRLFIPLPIVELSHFMASVFGVMLLILAWGIYQRRDSAYHLTLYMLALGAVFAVMKGFKYEEAAILALMFLALAPAGRHFYRKTSFVNERFSPGWMVAVGVVIASSIWLGFFAYKHVAYSNELWWQFSFHGNASRFLRASVGSVVAFIAVAVLKLIAPVKNVKTTDAIDGVLLNRILSCCPISSAQLALLGDKSFLISNKSDAFIMYGVSGRSWIVMGDPVGNQEAFRSLVWQFRDLCDRHGGWPLFYEVSAEYLPLYLDIGLTFLKMGESAFVETGNFSIDGGERKGLRHSKRRIENDGFSFRIVPSADVAAVLPELKRVSSEWLLNKNTREKRFSMGYFDEAYLMKNPVAVVEKGGTVVAFANLWLAGTKDEISVDLMRHSAAAPGGVMDFLFVNSILWGKEQGYKRFDLGMAPFSGLESGKFSPLWYKLGSLLFTHGEEIYNFQGLRKYKEKFNPVWRPKYLALPGGFYLPLMLKDLSALISGGIKGIVMK
jgi:phosphatidylglycerol lysyltransferase